MCRLPRHTHAGALIVALAVSALFLFAPSAPAPFGWVAAEQASATPGCGHTGGTAPRLSGTYMRRGIVCLINRARRRHGLSPYRPNFKLTVAATRHSQSMVHRHYFSHYGPQGSTPGERIARTGYFNGTHARAWGENIAAGKRHRGSPKAIFRAWMGSSGHRAVILSGTFRHVGIGVAKGYPNGGRGGATYTLDVAMRRG
jgi:uncharacterized protein YkwD